MLRCQFCQLQVLCLFQQLPTVLCPWFSMCLFGKCWSTERSFDFASLIYQNSSSSLFICWNVTVTFINLSLFSMLMLWKTCFSHSLMMVTHRGWCLCLCWVFLHLRTFRWALRCGVAAGGTGWDRGHHPTEGDTDLAFWRRSWSRALHLKFLVCFCSRSWLWLPSQNTKDGLFGSELPRWRPCQSYVMDYGNLFALIWIPAFCSSLLLVSVFWSWSLESECVSAATAPAGQ